MAQSVEGFLRRYKDSISKEYSKLVRDGNYTNDKVLSSLSFGIWVFLFSRGCYKESGKTLLRIFPNKPHGLNQADIYRGLDTIRLFRNRMAHHEPLCFDRAGEIDVSRAEEVYELVCDYIHYLGFNPRDVLYGIEKPEKVMACIGELMKR
jgi:hypothetical protein